MTSEHAGSREYVVQTDDGSNVTYTLRGLAEEGQEVQTWTEFCARSFAYKPNPPAASYFARHYHNDPDRSASLIRVAVSHDGRIVASCRVFLRRISLGKQKNSGECCAAAAAAGGIGEVCTDAKHRRRGLAAQLLRDAVACIGAAGIGLSLLHSAPSFFPVYEKAGYACVTSQWSEATIDCNKLLELDEQQVAEREAVKVRQVRFPADTEQLMSIHQSYSERRFVGCVVRSKEYWERYISAELQGSLWVLENRGDDGQIFGWMSIRNRGNRHQLCEFGCKDTESVPAVFRRLLRAVLEEELFDAGVIVKLHMPTAVLQEVQSGCEDSKYTTEGLVDNDRGWMYKQLTDDAVSMPELATSRPHLIWPADSF